MKPVPQIFCLFLTITALVTGSTCAHESPEHTVKELTTHIETEPTPENFYQRAIAYRALGQMQHAVADLQKAVSLAPNQLSYQLELSRTQLSDSKPGKALTVANQALKLATNPSQKATCHILRAEAYHLNKRFKPSLEACQLAFREVPKGEIEWFILRSENQRQLGLHQQRLTNLKAGFELSHSVVLKSHWIDAIIDAGEFKTALPLIESELVDRRWTSSWLIRRARTYLGLERNAEANADLHSALAEINNRLNPTHPDPLLLADQGIAYVLLGNKPAAINCLKNLKQHRAAPWITSRLESMLADM